MSTNRELVADYNLPEVPCSAAPRINPHYPVIRWKHASWVYKHIPLLNPGAIHRSMAHLDVLVDSLYFPDGLAERVYHHACWTTVIIDVDDLAVLKRELFEPVAADLERELLARGAAEQADNPYGRAFTDVWSTFKKNAPSEGVYQRMRQAWREWFVGVSKENELRENAKALDLESLIQIRQITVGIRPYFVAFEYMLDIDVAEVAKDPDVQRMREAGAAHVHLSNDLYSYRKEYSHGDSVNAVAVMRRSLGYGLQQAIDAVYERLALIDEELSRLSRLLHERYARHPLGERLHTYIDAYHTFVAGNLQWHLETPRYNGEGYVWDGLRARRITVDSKLFPIAPLLPSRPEA